MLSTEDSTMVSYKVFEKAMLNFAVLIFDNMPECSSSYDGTEPSSGYLIHIWPKKP